METWAIIVIAILAVAAIAIAIAVFFLQKHNAEVNQSNILYPFSGSVDSKGTVALLDSNKNPQIDCSATGGVINIVGAFMDIEDPYGECAPQSSPVLNLTCGIPGGKVACKQQADCGGGMICNGGVCEPATALLKDTTKKTGLIDTANSQCTSTGGSYCPIQPGTPCQQPSDCNDPSSEVMSCVSGTCQVNANKTCYGVNTNHNTCALFPLCSNATLESNVSNNVCSVNSQNYTRTQCMARDASAYLAAKCNGKATCSAMWDVTDPENGFGPLPCNIDPANIGGLPITPSGGGNYNQGYYVHGIYTCVPKS